MRASYAVKDIVAKYGGKALMNRVGHAFIKRRMREENAMFGGEVTGHYYFRDNFYADNGFIPALLILELMSKKGQSLRDLLKPLREKYFISGEINTKVASMAGRAARRSTSLAASYADGQRLYASTASRSEFPDWHFNVRGIEHRAAAAPESRGDDAGDHGSEARRGAGDHPVVVSGAGPC